MIQNKVSRRHFLQSSSATAAGGLAALSFPNIITSRCSSSTAYRKPNILFVFGDQWRAQALGYMGNRDVRTPHIDRLAGESVNLSNAVSGCPVCCPYRASLLTGMFPLSHGVFLNDLYLRPEVTSIAEVLNDAGYDTGYIGKWHLDGQGRSKFTPKERRQGFQFWKALECSHEYNNSYYYADEDVKLKWDGYDSIAQTRETCSYIRSHAKEGPFALFLSWGTPHAPYLTAPQKYRDMFQNRRNLRPNVPDAFREQAREDISGYYAHIAALDDCMAMILNVLKEQNIEQNTILVFTSDHGDMLYSHGAKKKQQPYEESIRVPFLLRYPDAIGPKGRMIDMPFNTPDIMPTLLGICGIDIPDTVEGTDYSGVLTGQAPPANDAVLISCPSPFGQWDRRKGGREYRGIRTRRYTYTRDLNGPWLLYDNWQDPYQLDNLCNSADYAVLRKELEGILSQKLAETNDQFLPGEDYIKQWGYKVDEYGTVPYWEYDDGKRFSEDLKKQ